MSDKSLPAVLPRDIKKILDETKDSHRKHLERLLIQSLSLPPTPKIQALWDQPELATSYWLFLMTGINQSDEEEIAKELLFWKAMIAKDYSRVSCVQSSERDAFRYCTSIFNIERYPVLILGVSPTMKEIITIDGDLLRELGKKPGRLQRFLTQIHYNIEDGKSLKEISKELDKEKFWKGLKMVYGEAKSFFSFSVKADVA